MNRFQIKTPLIGCLLIGSLAMGQAAGQTVYPMAPAWTPVSGSSPIIVNQKPGMLASTGFSNHQASPYYQDSPRYSGGFSASSTPTPAYPGPMQWSYIPSVASTQPAQPPMQVIVVQPPPAAPPTATAPVVQAPTPAPTPLPTPAPPPAQEKKPAVDPVPAVSAASATEPKPLPKKEPPATNPPKQDAPFIDERVFLPGPKVWREYDISGYTSRFSPADKPEEGVRKWILAETGPNAWHGGDVSSLSVSPQKVTVYHSSEVQKQVADVLGRFVWYAPGEFRCRTRILNVAQVQWRTNLLPRLKPAGASEPGREAWIIDAADAQTLLTEATTSWSGPSGLLADKQFRIANGQSAEGSWSTKAAGTVKRVSLNGSSASANDAEDLRTRKEDMKEGVHFVMSPLICQDALSIDLDLSIKATKLASAKEVKLGGGPTVEVPEVMTATLQNRYRIPPGKLLLCSLGLLPSIESHKGLLGRDKREEVLVLIEITPDQANTVAGKALPAPRPSQPPPETARTSSKPQRPVTKRRPATGGWDRSPPVFRAEAL